MAASGSCTVKAKVRRSKFARNNSIAGALGTLASGSQLSNFQRLIQRYSILVDLLGSIIFGDERVDINKVKCKFSLAERKILQGRQTVRDIIAIGGLKTYQLNNLELFFDENRPGPDGQFPRKRTCSPTLRQIIDSQNREVAFKRLDVPKSDWASSSPLRNKYAGSGLAMTSRRRFKEFTSTFTDDGGSAGADSEKVTPYNNGLGKLSLSRQGAQQRLQVPTTSNLHEKILPDNSQEIRDVQGIKNHSKVGRYLDHKRQFKNLLRTEVMNENWVRNLPEIIDSYDDNYQKNKKKDSTQTEQAFNGLQTYQSQSRASRGSPKMQSHQKPIEINEQDQQVQIAPLSLADKTVCTKVKEIASVPEKETALNPTPPPMSEPRTDRLAHNTNNTNTPYSQMAINVSPKYANRELEEYFPEAASGQSIDPRSTPIQVNPSLAKSPKSKSSGTKKSTDVAQRFTFNGVMSSDMKNANKERSSDSDTKTVESHYRDNMALTKGIKGNIESIIARLSSSDGLAAGLPLQNVQSSDSIDDDHPKLDQMCPKQSQQPIELTFNAFQSQHQSSDKQLKQDRTSEKTTTPQVLDQKGKNQLGATQQDKSTKKPKKKLQYKRSFLADAQAQTTPAQKDLTPRIGVEPAEYSSTKTVMGVANQSAGQTQTLVTKALTGRKLDRFSPFTGSMNRASGLSVQQHVKSSLMLSSTQHQESNRPKLLFKQLQASQNQEGSMFGHQTAQQVAQSFSSTKGKLIKASTNASADKLVTIPKDFKSFTKVSMYHENKLKRKAAKQVADQQNRFRATQRHHSINTPPSSSNHPAAATNIRADQQSQKTQYLHFVKAAGFKVKKSLSQKRFSERSININMPSNHGFSTLLHPDESSPQDHEKQKMRQSMQTLYQSQQSFLAKNGNVNKHDISPCSSSTPSQTLRPTTRDVAPFGNHNSTDEEYQSLMVPTPVVKDAENCFNSQQHYTRLVNINEKGSSSHPKMIMNHTSNSFANRSKSVVSSHTLYQSNGLSCSSDNNYQPQFQGTQRTVLKPASSEYMKVCDRISASQQGKRLQNVVQSRRKVIKLGNNDLNNMIGPNLRRPDSKQNRLKNRTKLLLQKDQLHTVTAATAAKQSKDESETTQLVMAAKIDASNFVLDGFAPAQSDSTQIKLQQNPKTGGEGQSATACDKADTDETQSILGERIQSSLLLCYSRLTGQQSKSEFRNHEESMPDLKNSQESNKIKVILGTVTKTSDGNEASPSIKECKVTKSDTNESPIIKNSPITDAPTTSVTSQVLQLQKQFIHQQQAQNHPLQRKRGSRASLFGGIVIGQNLIPPATLNSQASKKSLQKSRQQKAEVDGNSAVQKNQKHPVFLSQEEISAIGKEMKLNSSEKRKSESGGGGARDKNFLEKKALVQAKKELEAFNNEPIVNIVEIDQHQNKVSTMGDVPDKSKTSSKKLVMLVAKGASDLRNDVFEQGNQTEHKSSQSHSGFISPHKPRYDDKVVDNDQFQLDQEEEKASPKFPYNEGQTSSLRQRQRISTRCIPEQDDESQGSPTSLKVKSSDHDTVDNEDIFLPNNQQQFIQGCQQHESPSNKDNDLVMGTLNSQNSSMLKLADKSVTDSLVIHHSEFAKIEKQPRAIDDSRFDANDTDGEAQVVIIAAQEGILSSKRRQTTTIEDLMGQLSQEEKEEQSEEEIVGVGQEEQPDQHFQALTPIGKRGQRREMVEEDEGFGPTEGSGPFNQLDL